ncbi:MAG: hypothetical protein M3N46_14770 [Actinomycetota bacterium]|nr:hypothetical protein [Actinomycetota bacterium]
MKPPRYSDIKDVPLPTDVELLPHLEVLLDGAFRQQLWVMFLDHGLRPLPIVMPTDLPVEADPDDILGLRDFLSCVTLDVPSSTIVLTFERPGPAELTDRDRRWLRLIREAAIGSGFPFRGPYILLGPSVRQVPPDEYLAQEWVDLDDDDDPDPDPDPDS